jgi:hypothetical protein
MRELRLWLARIALAGLLLLLALPAVSQTCSLCYTQAASSGQRMIRALQGGIVILVLPPTLASIGMIFVVYHKRDPVCRDEGAPNPDTW